MRIKSAVVVIFLILSQLVFSQQSASAATFNCGTSGTYTVTAGVLQSGANCEGAVVLDSSVTTIAYATYLNYTATGVTSLTIPATTTSIASGMPISGSSRNLTEYIVDSDNPNYSSLNGVLYNKNKTVLIAYPYGKSGASFTVPDSVTTVNAYAFNCMRNLETVNIGANVTSMEYAFNFNGCSSTVLKEVVISASNADYSSIDGVFFNKSATHLMQYPGGRFGASYVVPTSVTRISNVDNTSYLTDITLPSGLLTIDTYAFERSTLTSVTIPDSVVNFGDYPFIASYSLQSITVGASNTVLKSIDGVLYSKDGTRLIEYPDGKRNPTYRIPASVTTVESQWIWYSEYLEKIYIPATVQTINSGHVRNNVVPQSYVIFEGNSALTSIAGGYGSKIIYCGTANAVITAWAAAQSKTVSCQSQAPSFSLSLSTLELTRYTSFTGYDITSTFAPDYFSISPTVPSGMYFNSTTGQLSGYPELASAAVTYTVTGHNSVGSSSRTLSLTVNPTQAEIAEAARLAAIEAERQRLAAAKEVVYQLLSNSKSISVVQFKEAGYKIVFLRSIKRLNTEILNLTISARLQDQILNLLIDEINFDQSFYDPLDRPGLDSYDYYGISGVTLRTLSTVNQAILLTPSAQRKDLKLMGLIVQKIAVVDLLCNPLTKKKVAPAQLVNVGLLAFDSKNKTSILNGLRKAPTSNIDTFEKMQAQILIEIKRIMLQSERLDAIKKKVRDRLAG